MAAGYNVWGEYIAMLGSLLALDVLQAIKTLVLYLIGKYNADKPYTWSYTDLAWCFAYHLAIIFVMAMLYKQNSSQFNGFHFCGVAILFSYLARIVGWS